MIVSLDDFPAIDGVLRAHLKQSQQKLVVTSGYFDPLHPGHISCIEASKDYGFLIVVVNGDKQLKIKKGKQFQPLQDRIQIVDALSRVDMVIPFDHDKDTFANEPLKVIRPDYFTKGGDWDDLETLPEWEVCKEYGIEVVLNVGREKKWASSDYLTEWVEFVNTKK